MNALASGKSSVEAALEAGYRKSYADVLSARTPKRSVMVNAIESLQSDLRKKTLYGMEQAVVEVDRAIRFGYERKNPMSVAKLLELKTRLHGLLKDDIRVEFDLRGALAAASHRLLNIIPVHPISLPRRQEEDTEGGAGDDNPDN